MTAHEVRRPALSLPEATEAAQIGHPNFRVKNKIAFLPLTLTLALSSSVSGQSSPVADPVRSFVRGFNPTGQDFFARSPQQTVLLRMLLDLGGGLVLVAASALSAEITRVVRYRLNADTLVRIAEQDTRGGVAGASRGAEVESCRLLDYKRDAVHCWRHTRRD